MAISFANATGNLFNELGKLGLLISQMRSYQTSQQNNFTNTTTGVIAQFINEPDIGALAGNAYIASLNGAGAGIGSLAQTIAAAAVNRIVFRDNPRIVQNLTQQNTLASLQEVIRQMKVQGATVLAHTVSATAGTFIGTGNGPIVTSIRRPVDGLVLEQAFAETVLLTCTADSYIGGATASNETISITGTGSANMFDFNWPLGSNASTAVSAIDGNADNSSGNLLNNSGFADFTSNVPDQFSLEVGTAGTNIAQETTLVYDTASAVRLIGDGSTLTTLTQTFDVSTGTSDDLESISQYSCNIFARRDGVAPAAGVLRIALVDGSGNVITDMNGAANSFTIDLTTLSTSYAAFNGMFRTPLVLPNTIKLQLKLTTALTNGRSVYLDKLSLGEATQIGVGQIWAAVHAGSSPFVQGDYATIVTTNSRGAGGSLNSFQTLLYRAFPDVRNSELLFPSAASGNTINDALIG